MDQTVKLWDPATGQLRETIVPGETGDQWEREHTGRRQLLARR